ncbi:MAG: ABC transporter ATP-binding protein [Clostridia bacterium]
MDERKTLLTVKDLRVCFNTDYGKITPVDGITFELCNSETTAIVGESGCGKSLTAFSIMGLIDKPGWIDCGSIDFDGREIVGLSQREWQKVRGKDMAMIFQEPLSSLNPVITVGNQISESIILHQKVNKAEARRRSVELLQHAGIPRAEKVFDSYPHSLSGGMRQRVMIAMALSCNPRLLIADEPTTALDVTIQAQILELMRKLSREYNTAIMLITHDLGVVAEMADQVIIMYAGQIVERADVFSLFHDALHPYTVGLLGSTPKLQDDTGELDAIEGVVPSPYNLPHGCRFCPRCPKAMDRCADECPPLITLADGRSVRCLLYSEMKGGECDERV